MINIVIFGVGQAYVNRKEFFDNNGEEFKIVAFLDNNPEYQGKNKDGIKVYSPDDIKKIDYDVVVILSNKFKKEITDQLLLLGVKEKIIWNFNTLKSQIKLHALKGKRAIYYGKREACKSKKGSILIITTDMVFSGGTLVAIYAAQSLKNMGYDVMLSAPSIDENLLQEIVDGGLDITIWRSLPYVFKEDEDWLLSYDFVIVNVFQMMNCAYEISKLRPVLWWIHEPRSMGNTYYQDTQKEFYKIDTTEWMNRLEILGVSNIAKEAFNYFYPSVMENKLPFGIPDRYIKKDIGVSQNKKIIFAVTAGFSIFKGQRVLVEAIKKLSYKEKKQIEIWFIGPSGQNQQDLEDICDEKENMRFLGLLSHEEVISNLPQIDVLVCPSLIETMSMSIIEGMMFEKLCITTDMTGVAEYIRDGENGFVVKAGDSDELAERMAWIINNRDKWDPIRKEARKTYEHEFTLEKLGERFDEELKNCKEKFLENLNQ